MQQADDFFTECKSLHDLISGVPASGFDQPTGFKNWTINTILRHLHVWNHAAKMALENPEGFANWFEGVAKYMKRGELNKFEHEWVNGLSGPDLLAAWIGDSRKVADLYRNTDPSQRIPWAGPSMSARSAITARLMETWAHGQAIYDVLGVVRKNSDAIRNIVILGVNTYGWAFKVNKKDAPNPMPHLRLTAPSGELWSYGDESQQEYIEGRAEEFCQVVTQTRNIADTSLEVHGANAKLWMNIAQCFAGPPETPPVPGSRKINSTIE